MSTFELISIALSILFFLVLSIHIFFAWNFDYWAKRNVPHEKPTPILGSFTFLMRQSPTDWFIQKHRQFKTADYFGIWIFRRPALVVSSPELARKILVKDFVYFRDRFLSSGSKDPLGGLNIFTVNDPLWSSIRRHLTPVFTSAKLRSLLGIKNFYSKELVDRIRREHVVKKLPTDLKDLFACTTTDIIGAASFGLQDNSTGTNDSELRRITREISNFTLKRGLEFSSIFFFPSLVDFFGCKFFTKDMSDYFKKIFFKVMEERSREPANVKKDLLDALIRIKTESKLEGYEDITDDIIVAQAAIFVQGGFDTSAVFFTYFFLEIAHNKTIQDRLYEELKSSQVMVEGNVDYDVVKNLPYLSMCIKESLRKYPAMGFLDRIAVKDYRVDRDLVIEKGTPVYVNAVGMQYDERYFPEPEKYDPERFSEENEKNMVPFTYMPFGEGPRNCIGIRFAYQTIKIVIAHLLLNFEVKPKPGQPSPRETPFDKKGVFIGPGIKINVVFHERNK